MARMTALATSSADDMGWEKTRFGTSEISPKKPVSTGPGDTVETCRSGNSSRIDRVKARSPALDAEYAASCGTGIMPAKLATLTIAPPFCSLSTEARVSTTGAVRLVVMMSPRARHGKRRMGPRWFSPALLTRMSNRPKWATTQSGRVVSASRSVTSAGNAAHLSGPRRATCSSSVALRRATIATRAPAPISFSVTARPMPEDAPVTSATLPAESARPPVARVAIVASLRISLR